MPHTSLHRRDKKSHTHSHSASPRRPHLAPQDDLRPLAASCRVRAQERLLFYYWVIIYGCLGTANKLSIQHVSDFRWIKVIIEQGGFMWQIDLVTIEQKILSHGQAFGFPFNKQCSTYMTNASFVISWLRCDCSPAYSMVGKC